MKNIAKHKSMILILLLLIAAVAIVGFFYVGKSGGIIAHAETEQTESPTIEDKLTFSLINNSTAYKVTARDKTITQITIPDTYRGLPVTEISDSAFTNCLNLVTVRVPFSVQRIGNNAFANCKSLERILGMPRVKTIGNNAFAMCVKLDTLILPSSVEYIGSTILRNNPNVVYSRKSEEELDALNPKWNASRAAKARTVFTNELVYEDVLDEDGDLIGYNIVECQNLDAEEDFVVSVTHNNLPVFEIKPDAFYFNQFRSLTIRYEADVAEHHTVNIGSRAFYGVVCEYIKLEVNISLNDPDENSPDYPANEKGYSSDVFSYSEAEIITIPDSLTFLSRNMFLGCSKLRTILTSNTQIAPNHLPDTVTSIHSQAFQECCSLVELYISNKVTNLGQDVFNGWGDSLIKQTIYIDLIKPPQSWNENWLGTLHENACVAFNKILVVLNKNGGDSSVGANYVYATYGETLDSVEAPIQTGKTFVGYYDSLTDGEQYYDSNMNGVKEWLIVEDSVLYAHWILTDYTVLLDSCGGTGGSPSVSEVHYMQTMPTDGLIAPTKRGYVFKGYYSQVNCGGTKYYNADMTSADNWSTAGGDTIYAGWEVITYDITYKLNCDSTVALDNYNTNAKQYTVNDTVKISSIQIGVYHIVWDKSVIEANTIGNITVTGSVHTNVSIWTTVLDVNQFGHLTVYLPASNFDSVCVIKVYNNVETLNVVGRAGVQYSLRISMQYHDAQNVKPYKLILNNVDMIAPAERCAITAFEDLYLYAYGVVKITGGDAPRCTSFNGDWEGYPASGDKPDISGNYAIYCKNLYIMSSQSLLIQGGSGMHGDQAYTQYRYFYGGTAASGVYVTGGNCEISCDHVTIRAGEAGDVSLYAYGCKGGYGAKAVSGDNFVGVKIADFNGIILYNDITLYDSPNKNKGGSGGGVTDPEYPPYPPYPVDPPIITV